MDLNASYTYDDDGDPCTESPWIKTWYDERNKVTVTHVYRYFPLLADRIDAITDDGARKFTLLRLIRSGLWLVDRGHRTTATGSYGGDVWREYGCVATSYQGTPHLSIDDVLDLGEAIRAELRARREL